MEEVLKYVLPAICTIVVAFIELRGVRERKAAKIELERTERRAKRRAEESQLSMQLMSSTCKVAVVTAKAVTNQKINGDVEEAMNAAKVAQAKYDAYIQREAACQTAKV